MNHFLKRTKSFPHDSNRRVQLAQKPKILKPIVHSLLTRVLRKLGNPPIKLILPGGDEVATGGQETVGSICFLDYRTLVQCCTDPLFQFGEAYSNGRLEVEGNLADCLTAVFRSMNYNAGISPMQRLLFQMRRPNKNSLGRSQDNIHHHYDLGNDFYRLWLDEQMLYTCAYYSQPSFSLEQAQVAKMDHVCRKLQLRPGMKVVEAGCGWGALALHMAKHYGVQVAAYNISAEQIAQARRTAETMGIQRQVQFIEDDWRNIRGRFDAFVSVGMLEHIGVKNYSQFGETILRSLKPEGFGLIHTIGQNRSVPFNSWMERRIFPGAYPPTLREMMDIFEAGNFQVLDVENLRLHYARTLKHWLDRFESNSDSIEQEFDNRFLKMWRMYLAGSIAAFESGYLQLFQVVFANRCSNNVPRTREHLYQAKTAQGRNGSNRPTMSADFRNAFDKLKKT